MSTNYEPTPEQVERMTGEMMSRWHSSSFDIRGWARAEVVRILQRQHERERGLREALATYAVPGNDGVTARNALAAHAALDASQAENVRLREALGRCIKAIRLHMPDREYDSPAMKHVVVMMDEEGV